MSLRLNVDVNQLLSDKWTWIISGLFLTVFGLAYQNFVSGIEFIDEAIHEVSSFVAFIGLFSLIIGVIWWIKDNWGNIQKQFSSY